MGILIVAGSPHHHAFFFDLPLLLHRAAHPLMLPPQPLKPARQQSLPPTDRNKLCIAGNNLPTAS
ncbi:hypothetical protein VFPFJ_00225 [Purpureocillium lilacinum]|uniref:Uncharacterized protein n=1 Tax=Purpureocillium lilacinum TaxID=33203 RepID=A0A179HUQ5_PURLI|nr:hypothetical protein VFPFJ_00225 [Purpureocillium lilacinum]OAQ86159.1 hypothetical protein VFPBJ_00199 [Purpureocillium lilacinum]OAQ94117.1 hypothetical protein VFPFJ_00225 [Purpureocillium lilacinum]